MNTAFIICTRYASNRVPGKAIRKINGEEALSLLIRRLKKTPFDIILACPPQETHIFSRFKDDRVKLFFGAATDPLKRMSDAALACGVDTIIRVTHDKVLVEPTLFMDAFRVFSMTNKLGYLYSSSFTPGSGFEIFSSSLLHQASKRYRDVEHLSYALRSIDGSRTNWDPPKEYQSPYRYLLDYEQDFMVMETLFSQLGNDCTLLEAIDFSNKNPWLHRINQMPEVSVYTCAHNAEKWIEKCMGSVNMQANFKNIEYLLIDDFSSDKTPLLMSKFKSKYNNVGFIRNQENIGLSSSSNIALGHARGKYIIRIDADDFFTSNQAILDLVNSIRSQKKDVVYPDNFFGSMSTVQKGKHEHHVGGAIFSTMALNHLQFTQGLRGFEGYDLYKRAQDVLEIGYHDAPSFFYRQHCESMSKNDLAEREKLKETITQIRTV